MPIQAFDLHRVKSLHKLTLEITQLPYILLFDIREENALFKSNIAYIMIFLLVM